MKLKLKSKLPALWTTRGKISENANLASVPLTKQNQAFQVEAGIDLLGEVDCLSNTQFCSTCAPFHMAEELQPVSPAALSRCSHISPCQTTVPRKLGMQRRTRSIGLSVQGISLIPCPGHLEGQENFPNLTFFSKMLYFHLSLFSYLCSLIVIPAIAHSSRVSTKIPRLLLQNIIFQHGAFLLTSILPFFCCWKSSEKNAVLQKLRGGQKHSHIDLGITGYVAMAKLKNLHKKLVR